MNDENLRPHRFKTSEEAREMGRKGGIKSGESKRRKKALRECAMMVLQSEIPASIKKSIEKLTGFIPDDQNQIYTAMVAVMAREALKGDTRAFHEIQGIVEDISNQNAIDIEMNEDALSKSLRELGESL